MSLDRDAARALFEKAPPPPAEATPIVGQPVAPDGEIPITAADAGVYERMTHSHSPRRRLDWRYAAPVAVAAVCAGVAIAVASYRGGSVRPGADVARTEIVAPPTAPQPIAPPPVETAALTPEPVPEPAAPAPAARAAVRQAPAARRAPTAPRIAAAPSALESATNVSGRESYVPPPALGTPAQVTLTPPPPPAPSVVSPPSTPEPETEPPIPPTLQ
ncbi:MAG: hypothetical protein ACOY4K_06005 [Pseudomonadota bacterium]